MQDDLKLATKLTRVLREALSEASPLLMHPHRKFTRVSGSLLLDDESMRTADTAACTFTVRSSWVEDGVTVETSEAWVRSSKEWHASDGLLCVDLDARWSHYMKSALSSCSEEFAIHYAATWCLRSTVNLLKRHLLAFREDMDHWPDEWDYWDHDKDKAIAHFRKEVEEGRHAA